MEEGGRPLMILGDCLEKMRLVPDGSVDMVLVDMPYGTTYCPWDIVIPMGPVWDQIHRVAKKNASVLTFAKEPFTSLLVTGT